MDKKIEKRKNIIPKLFLGILLFCFIAYFSLLLFNKEKQTNINKEHLTIKTVQRDYFEDIIIFQGEVEPLNTILINTIESGSVRNVFVENGELVEKEQPLLEIYNPNTEFNYLTQETAIIEQINNLINIRVNIKNQQFDLNRTALEIEHEFNNEEREYQLNKELFEAEILAENDYKKSKEDFRFQKAQQEMVFKNIKNEKIDRIAQMERINNSIQKMERTLKKLKANQQNFIVKASARGKLSSFNPVVGQSFQGGDALGKIDLLDGYKIAIQVDEFYNSKIKKGQIAEIKINDKIFELEVNKVLPEVINGEFRVELKFIHLIPKNIKRGMTLPVKIYLSNNNSKALLLAKGGFYQSSGGQFVYVLSEENKAEKRYITIGKSNSYYYEVIDGLQENEKVITSSYEDYKTMSILNLR